MAATEVEVSGFHYSPSVLVTSSGQSNWTAMISVKAPSVAQSNRAPIHVVVVLHHAGKIHQGAAPLSSREPSRFDLLRTMEFIIEQIRENGKGDHFTIVAESKGNISEMSIDDWDPQKGEKLEEEGTHVLSKEGLERAVKILQKESGANPKRAGFILLLSDAKSDFKCDDSLLISKYPVHAFGLGNHDPAALYCIAEKSKGTYSCITGMGKNLNSRLTEAIALCLVGLKTVVAVDTCVDIEVARFRQERNANPSSIVNSFEIRKIQSGGHNTTTHKGSNRQDGDWASGKITVGVLYADEVKHFIVDIAFSSSNTGEKTRAAVLTAEVKYKNSSHKDVQSQCELPLLVTMISDAAAIGGYERLQQLVPCRHIVLQQMIWFDVLEVLLSFANDCLLKKKQGNLGAALQTKWDELKKKKKRRFQTAQEMGLDLGGIRDDMDAMVMCLKGGKGLGSGGRLASIYSCVSSYQMQRIATTGLLRTATTFLTPAMEEMVEKATKQQLAKESHTKSKHATELFDTVEELLGWFKMYPTTTKASSSSGGADESHKHVIDFVESLIYEAAHLAVNQWQRTTSGEPVHSMTATPPPPPVEEGDPTEDDAKSKCAIELLDKIDNLLNLSKTCLAVKASASSSGGAGGESQKRVDDLIRRLIYEVAADTIDVWWRANSGQPPHGTPAAPTQPQPVEEGDAKSKHAIGLLDRIDKLLYWSGMFPATKTSSSGGADDESQKRVDDLTRRLIYEAAVVAIKEWRATSSDKQPHNTGENKYAIRMFNDIKNQLDFFENDPYRNAFSSRGAHESLQTNDIEQGRIYDAAVQAINEYRRRRATSSKKSLPK